MLAQPILTGQGSFDIKAISRSGIKDQAKASFEDQKRVAQEKAAQLSGVEHAFAETNEKSLERGADRMSRASTRGTLGLPVLDQRPIEEGKKGTIIGDQGIMIEQGGDGGLVKESGRRYHGKKLLL